MTVDQQSSVEDTHATVVFNVGNDRPDVSTTGLVLTFPTEHPLTEVLTQPKPGWEVTVERSTATASPAPSPAADSGAAQALAQVSRVRWSAAPGPAAIGPNQFDLFSVSVGPIPAGIDKLVFQAAQTYSDGQSVSWSDEAAAGSTGGTVRPAPVLTLTPSPAAVPPAPVATAAATTAGAQPEGTPLPSVDLAAVSAPDSRAARVTLGLSIGVGLVLLGVAGASMARRREGAASGPSVG